MEKISPKYPVPGFDRNHNLLITKGHSHLPQQSVDSTVDLHQHIDRNFLSLQKCNCLLQSAAENADSVNEP